MSTKVFAAILFSFLCIAVASAQDYTIRANRGLNLRAAPSLNATIAATVRTGDILKVIGHTGGWLKIRHESSEVWLADWVNYSRVDQQPAAAGTGTADVDNCCFVDRQCNSEQQWVDGYWAYQNGHCAAPMQTQSTMSTPAADDTMSEAIDNCCFAGWHCQSEQQWVNGYWAYQNNQCDSAARMANANSCCQLGWNCSGILDHWLGEKVVSEGYECGLPVSVAYGRTVLVGSETFIAQITAALEYLKSRVPHWYAYIVNGVSKIRGGPFGPGTFAYGDAFNIAPPHAREGAVVLAGTLLHEACHVNRSKDGSDQSTSAYDTVEGFSVEENICETLREGALTEANPSRPPNPWLADAIAFFRNHGGNYDFQAAANGQRDRAFWLLSQGI